MFRKTSLEFQLNDSSISVKSDASREDWSRHYNSRHEATLSARENDEKTANNEKTESVPIDQSDIRGRFPVQLHSRRTTGKIWPEVLLVDDFEKGTDAWENQDTGKLEWVSDAAEGKKALKWTAADAGIGHTVFKNVDRSKIDFSQYDLLTFWVKFEGKRIYGISTRSSSSSPRFTATEVFTTASIRWRSLGSGFSTRRTCGGGRMRGRQPSIRTNRNFNSRYLNSPAPPGQDAAPVYLDGCQANAGLAAKMEESGIAKRDPSRAAAFRTTCRKGPRLFSRVSAPGMRRSQLLFCWCTRQEEYVSHGSST